MRNNTKTVVLLLSDRVIARFQYQSQEPKNPTNQAKQFLAEILADESHEFHDALMSGEITEVSGQERSRKPTQKITL